MLVRRCEDSRLRHIIALPTHGSAMNGTQDQRRRARQPIAASIVPSRVIIHTLSIGVGVVRVGCGSWTLPAALAEQGAGLPDGAHVTRPVEDTDAVLLIVAGGSALTIAVTVYKRLPPAGKAAIGSDMAPLPDADGHTAPPEPTHVHAKSERPAGIGSFTSVPGAATVPTLSTAIV
jgi:hypothetical protein